MSLWIHTVAVVGMFISAWLVKCLAAASYRSASSRLEQGPKISLKQAYEEVAGIKHCVYMPGDDQEFIMSWGHVRNLILVKGPRNNISHPAFSHELGHARICRQNLDKRGRPGVVDCSKNYVTGKLAGMFWYEYRVERQAWLLSQYWNTSFSKAALRNYGLMALWDDLDIAALMLLLVLLARLLI